jgi:hypothetical protein
MKLKNKYNRTSHFGTIEVDDKDTKYCNEFCSGFFMYDEDKSDYDKCIRYHKLIYNIERCKLCITDFGVGDGI